MTYCDNAKPKYAEETRRKQKEIQELTTQLDLLIKVRGAPLSHAAFGPTCAWGMYTQACIVYPVETWLSI